MELTTIINGEMLGYDEDGIPPDSSLPLQRPQGLDVARNVTEDYQLNKTEMKMERMGGKIKLL